MTKYSRITNQELLTTVLKEFVQRNKLQNKVIGDVAFGAVMKNSSDWNLSREVVLGSGLHADTPAYNVQRACGTGLETTWQLALKIASGAMDSGLAGGSDTNSDLPILFPRAFAWKLLDIRNARSSAERLGGFLKFGLKDIKPVFPAVVEPRTGLSMGEHCEKMVQEWKITREAQDQLAMESHKKAEAAYQAGFYDDLVIEFQGLKKDPIVRGDTSMEKLAKLKPAFDRTGKGTLTAGNSTPLTDGAAIVLLGTEEFAKANNLPVLAHFVDAQVAAVDYVNGEGLLMAPTIAVSELLKRHNLQLQDFDFYEIHEAFAGQTLCTFKAWESAEYCKNRLGRSQAMGPIDRSKLNVKGGSLALGHPFGATGGRIVASLAKMLHEKGRGRGLISICTAGGMGVVAILER
jgi:acetyl-CoA C-acetyltransferase